MQCHNGIEIFRHAAAEGLIMFSTTWLVKDMIEKLRLWAFNLMCYFNMYNFCFQRNAEIDVLVDGKLDSSNVYKLYISI